MMSEYAKLVSSFDNMATPHVRYGKKTYTTLGRLLVKKRPEIAEELLAYCQLVGETDLDKIPDFFKRFCEYLHLNPDEYTGKLKDPAKQNVRRLFIGAMLHLYNRHAFHQPHTNPVMRSGFVSRLSDCQGVDISRISHVIRQVMLEEKVYDDFRTKLESIVTHLKQFTNSQIETGKD